MKNKAAHCADGPCAHSVQVQPTSPCPSSSVHKSHRRRRAHVHAIDGHGAAIRRCPKRIRDRPLTPANPRSLEPPSPPLLFLFWKQSRARPPPCSSSIPWPPAIPHRAGTSRGSVAASFIHHGDKLEPGHPRASTSNSSRRLPCPWSSIRSASPPRLP